MSDILRRLRRWGHSGECGCDRCTAANEIERLTSENKWLRGSITDMDLISKQAKEIERLTAEVTALLSSLIESESRTLELTEGMLELVARDSSVQPHSVEMPTEVEATLNRALRDSVTVIGTASSKQDNLPPNAFREALIEIVEETDGLGCDGCYVRNKIASNALAGSPTPESKSQERRFDQQTQDDSSQKRMKPYLQTRCGDCGTPIDNCLDTCPECGSGEKALVGSSQNPLMDVIMEDLAENDVDPTEIFPDESGQESQ